VQELQEVLYGSHTNGLGKGIGRDLWDRGLGNGLGCSLLCYCEFCYEQSRNQGGTRSDLIPTCDLYCSRLTEPLPGFLTACGFPDPTRTSTHFQRENGALTLPRLCDKMHRMPSVSEFKALPSFLFFVENYFREGAEEVESIRSELQGQAGVWYKTGMASLLGILPPSPTTDKGGSSRLRLQSAASEKVSFCEGVNLTQISKFWVTHFDQPSLSHRSLAAGASHWLPRVGAA